MLFCYTTLPAAADCSLDSAGYSSCGRATQRRWGGLRGPFICAGTSGLVGVQEHIWQWKNWHRIFCKSNRLYCFTPLYSQRCQCYFSHPIFVAASSLWSLCPTFQLLCTIEDLKEMGIPLGPRKKIAKFVKERVNKQVGASLGYLCLSRMWPWLLRTRVDLLCPGCPSGSAGEESRG